MYGITHWELTLKVFQFRSSMMVLSTPCEQELDRANTILIAQHRVYIQHTKKCKTTHLK